MKLALRIAFPLLLTLPLFAQQPIPQPEQLQQGLKIPDTVTLDVTVTSRNNPKPVAGLTDRETEETSALILGLAKDRTIIVVEHDMAFVRSLGARVTVLHEGSVLAEGTLADVQNNAQVIDVYLGR